MFRALLEATHLYVPEPRRVITYHRSLGHGGGEGGAGAARGHGGGEGGTGTVRGHGGGEGGTGAASGHGGGSAGLEKVH